MQLPMWFAVATASLLIAIVSRLTPCAESPCEADDSPVGQYITVGIHVRELDG